MKLMNYVWGALCVLLLLTSCSKKEEAKVESKTTEQELDEMASKTLIDGKIPGMIVGVWDASKNIEWTTAKGNAIVSPNSPMTTTTITKIGSITKTFVSTVLLQLYEEGALNLEDTVSKYFPNFPKGKTVTLRMLCNMTSGIADYTKQPEFIAAALANPNKQFTPQELIDFALKRDYLFAPGSKCEYSNTNYIIIGAIIEQVTKMKLGQVLQDRIFSKMNMTNTKLADTKEMPNGVAHGYMDTTNSGNLTDVTNQLDPSLSWATGGALSNLSDLKLWSTGLANGILLKDTTFSKRLIDSRDYLTIPTVNITVKYGEGIMSSLGFIGHAGLINGYSSLMMTNPNLKCTIIILYNKHSSNGGKDDPSALFIQILSKLHPELLFSSQKQ